MITITDAAAKQIKRNLEKRGRGIAIRVGVTTNGCAGYRYILEYVDELSVEDILLSDNNTVIVTDPKSIPVVAGTTIDYVRQGLNEGFEFSCPQIKSWCGCNESFTI